jgi:glycosyltransferase involved in cell wall biosynthesis
MPSIVIPAHNEQRGIARCLRAILQDATPGELDVVVVCNGCDDRTAEIARRYEPRVRVLELAQASKSAALNLGDMHAKRFPRVYLDADTELDTAGVRALAKALGEGALVAYPRVRPDLTGVSRAVRLYYRTWERLCYERGDLIGAGAYALSADGRRRFAAFPTLIADDFFVRRLFRRREAALVDAALSVIRPPNSVSALTRVLIRVTGGNDECQLRYEGVFAEDERRPSLAAVVGRRPSLWLPALVYVGILGRAKLHAKWRARAGRPAAWLRDDTTRGHA